MYYQLPRSLERGIISIQKGFTQNAPYLAKALLFAA
jgi:hypothetical protein